jgi:glycosyltransferase involved in cell wall biosynthesis
MNTKASQSYSSWVFQTGEPLHIDSGNARPMRAINLSNALVQAGHKVLLWSSAFYHQEKRHRFSNDSTIRVSDNLTIRLIPSRGYERHVGFGRLIDHSGLALNLKKVLQHMDHLPDVAFIGYPPIETAAIMVRWLTKRGVPSLLDVKDQWPPLFLERFPSFLRPLGRLILRPYFYLAKRAMNDATGLSAMANGFLDWALAFSGRARGEMDGVFPLTSPVGQVTVSQLKRARSWWDDQGIVDNRKPRFCFIGSHSPAFDFKSVYEAAKMTLGQQPQCEFVVCGHGNISSELRTMMGGLPNVYFPGWVNRPQIEALAERCQAALAPYHDKEDFRMSLPNKIIDALSLGLPILCSLRGQVASLIASHGVGLRYGSDTGRSLHDCIQLLTENTALQKSMSWKAHTLYSERFSFEMVYGKLVKHLEKLSQN